MTNEEFLCLLKDHDKTLYAIHRLNEKIIKNNMSYGEVTIVEHVQNGRVTRVEATSKFSEVIDKI